MRLFWDAKWEIISKSPKQIPRKYTIELKNMDNYLSKVSLEKNKMMFSLAD